MEGTIMSTAKSRTAKRVTHGARRYMDLVEQFPLRPIRTKRDYLAATKIMDKLAVRGEDDLSRDELDYLDVLTNLVEAYDGQHVPEPGDGTPLERLRALMEESETSTADLGRLLGNSGLASQIILGRRGLSKTHIRILSRHFNLDADYFL
jgi:HTH-type transcriptional regulator / antitoxin HigA